MFRFSEIGKKALGQSVPPGMLDKVLPPEQHRDSWVCGLDLGFSVDYSCLTILDRKQAPGQRATHDLVHLQRWQLGTPHYDVLSTVDDILLRLPKRPTTLVVDASGVGAPIFLDMRRDQTRRSKYAGAKLVGVTITSGRTTGETEDQRGLLRVSKAALVGSALSLFGSGRLRISRDLPLVATIKKELQSFQIRVNNETRNESYEGARGSHDDSVLGLCLACFWSERLRTAPATYFPGDDRGPSFL